LWDWILPCLELLFVKTLCISWWKLNKITPLFYLANIILAAIAKSCRSLSNRDFWSRSSEQYWTNQPINREDSIFDFKDTISSQVPSELDTFTSSWNVLVLYCTHFDSRQRDNSLWLSALWLSLFLPIQFASYLRTSFLFLFSSIIDSRKPESIRLSINASTPLSLWRNKQKLNNSWSGGGEASMYIHTPTTTVHYGLIVIRSLIVD
jgi:hypothetical protein